MSTSERTMVVATLYKLLMEDGVFKKENKKVLREKFVVPKDTVEKYNSQYKNCGKFYEVHEKETEKYYEDCEKRNIQLAEDEAASKQLSNTLHDLAKGKVADNNAPVDNKAITEAAEKKAEEEASTEIEGLFKTHESLIVDQITAEEACSLAKEALEKEPENKEVIKAFDDATKVSDKAKDAALKVEGALDAAKAKVEKPGLLKSILSKFTK